MTLRKVPGALALGLLASLGAHAVLYRGAHAMGAEYHALLLQLAGVGLAALLVAFAAAARQGANGTADGSILAARLGRRLPAPWLVFAAATGWFNLAETLEPHHGSAPIALTALALAGSAWLIVILARGLLGALARVAIAVAKIAFAARTRVARRVLSSVPPPKPVSYERRRFARPPPPIVSLHCA
ncbi:MAG: hypothetical protein JO263_03990 [Candidatus Eremiobacteraeota bacterium]|nr:hypothetical protein [Candidatus Eremiobacteraeota bacterium]